MESKKKGGVLLFVEEVRLGTNFFPLAFSILSFQNQTG